MFCAADVKMRVLPFVTLSLWLNRVNLEFTSVDIKKKGEITFFIHLYF